MLHTTMDSQRTVAYHVIVIRADPRASSAMNLDSALAMIMSKDANAIAVKKTSTIATKDVSTVHSVTIWFKKPPMNIEKS